MISDFPSLIAAARQQVQPQRLLFVFLETSLPKDCEDEEKNQFHKGEGGHLRPVMCVDKTLEELGTFADLVAESENMEQNWQIVLVACMSGKNGLPPSPEESEAPLKMMMHTVESGGDLSRYMAFDKKGLPIQFT